MMCIYTYLYTASCKGGPRLLQRRPPAKEAPCKGFAIVSAQAPGSYSLCIAATVCPPWPHVRSQSMFSSSSAHQSASARPWPRQCRVILRPWCFLKWWKVRKLVNSSRVSASNSIALYK